MPAFQITITRKFTVFARDEAAAKTALPQMFRTSDSVINVEQFGTDAEVGAFIDEVGRAGPPDKFISETLNEAQLREMAPKHWPSTVVLSDVILATNPRCEKGR